MGKVIFREASRQCVRATALNAKSGLDPSKPLANVKHERFCWAIMQGNRLGPAYEIAGFSGKSSRLPWQLRHRPHIDARINWLLAKRIKDDTKARHKGEKKISDTRERVIRELERLAFTDARDLVQWSREPKFDDEGHVIGFVDVMRVTPSHLMTKDQAASVRSISTKSGTLKFETHDKLAALDKLARALGIYQEPAAPASVSQSVTLNQISFNGDNSLEAARRLAFALEKARQMDLAGPVIEGGAVGAQRKEASSGE